MVNILVKQSGYPNLRQWRRTSAKSQTVEQTPAKSQIVEADISKIADSGDRHQQNLREWRQTSAKSQTVETGKQNVREWRQTSAKSQKVEKQSSGDGLQLKFVLISGCGFS